MSDSQARRFARDWRVIDQYTHSEQTPIYDDGGNITGYLTTSNGLSATVFQEVSTGRRYLAIRGTEATSGSDLWTDLVDLVAIGTPEHQSQYQSLQSRIRQWQTDGTLPASFTVAGHSLGGFLAAAVAIDFPLNVQHAYLYNAPGAGGVRANLELALEMLGGLPAGSRTLNLGIVTNLRATSGASLIAGLGQAWSTPTGIEIEAANGFGLGNHSIVRLTDALAIHAVYAELSPALTLAHTGQILQSAASNSSKTLEAALDALRICLLGSAALPGGASGPTVEENRDSLYANLYALQDSAAYKALKGSAAVRLTATQDATALVTNAKSDFGSFLAVNYLLPVVIEGAAGTLSGVHGDLYVQWQADQALTPEQRAAGLANFSDEYLADRAAFLTWKNKLALEDFAITDGAYTAGPDAYFSDLASGLQINLGSNGTGPANKPRYVFGGEQGDAVSGGSQGDRLYGRGGNDVLYGYDSNDYIEGNAGDDTLTAGGGTDTLVGGACLFLGEGGFSLQFNFPGVLTLDENTTLSLIVQGKASA